MSKVKYAPCKNYRTISYSEIDEIIKNLETKNEQLRKENKDLQIRNHIVPEHYLSESIDKCNELEKQIEKMKCCGNCSNYYLGEDRFYRCKAGSFFISCNGKNCKEWELVE